MAWYDERNGESNEKEFGQDMSVQNGRSFLPYLLKISHVSSCETEHSTMLYVFWVQSPYLLESHIYEPSRYSFDFLDAFINIKKGKTCFIAESKALGVADG